MSALATESFSWTTPDMKISYIPGKKIGLKGTALFSYEKYLAQGVSLNKRKYILDEVQKSARTLSGRPLDKNHELSAWMTRGQKGDRPKILGHVASAEPEDGAVEYVAEVNDPEYVEKIMDTLKFRKGEMSLEAYRKKWANVPIAGVSVDAGFRKAHCPECKKDFLTMQEFQNHAQKDHHNKQVNMEPHGIIYNGLSLVEGETPGVVGANFELTESLQGMQHLYESLSNHYDTITKTSSDVPLQHDPMRGDVSTYSQAAQLIRAQGMSNDEIAKTMAGPRKPRDILSVVEGQITRTPIIPYTIQSNPHYVVTPAGSPPKPLQEWWGRWSTFDACVSANSSKDNPEAFCNSIHGKGDYETWIQGVLQKTHDCKDAEAKAAFETILNIADMNVDRRFLTERAKTEYDAAQKQLTETQKELLEGRLLREAKDKLTLQETQSLNETISALRDENKTLKEHNTTLEAENTRLTNLADKVKAKFKGQQTQLKKSSDVPLLYDPMKGG